MTGKGLILIADPDPVWTDSMTRLLEAEGYTVLPARTGVQALYQASMRRPELILLAPDLPLPNGWELCRRLRRSPTTQGMKIVLLTLDGGRAHRTGADGYLVKGAQDALALPPVHTFRHPAPGILEDFRHRRHALAA